MTDIIEDDYESSRVIVESFKHMKAFEKETNSQPDSKFIPNKWNGHYKRNRRGKKR